MPRVLLACGLAWLACLGAGALWPGDLLAWELLAALPWGAACALKCPARAGDVSRIFAVAVLARGVLLLAPPVLSDDVFRYLWDGRVQLAGLDPYAFAPSARELAPLRDSYWAFINYRDLPTIYPPLAQFVFRVVASVWPTPLAFRALASAADIASVALLVGLLRRRGTDARVAVVLAWSPLAAVETAVGAHVDAAAITLLVAALLALERLRPLAAGVLAGLSLSVKLGAAALVPLLAPARRARVLVGVCIGLAPFALHLGGPIMPSLDDYARRWRHNDSAFALLHGAARVAVGDGRREWPQPLARWATGRPSRDVYADEAAGALARVAAVAIWLALAALAVARRADPFGGGLLLTTAALLLAPVVHPWYLTWLLPLLVVVRYPPLLLLAALAPLGYLASAAVWPRLVEYGVPALAALAPWAIGRARRALQR